MTSTWYMNQIMQVYNYLRNYTKEWENCQFLEMIVPCDARDSESTLLVHN